MARSKKVLKNRAQAKKFTFKYEAPKKTVAEVKGKYYPAEDSVAAKGPSPVRNAPRVRQSLTPGTVVILLAGRFRGKRVVVLKALASGLLLVAGPYGINGVPLRRVNQRYVIGTSTKVSLAGVDVSAINDDLFAREKTARKTGEAALFDATQKAVERLSPARKAAQDKVEGALKANVEKVPQLADYLKARFTLRNSDKPHLMKF